MTPLLNKLLLLLRQDRWLLAILASACLLYCVGITWGLPSSDGWDNDGVAPRDFLPGLLMSYTPGSHYIYPPLHLILLTLLTLPIWSVALLKAGTTAPEAVRQTFIQVPVMTSLALVARLLSALFSLGSLLALYKLGEQLGGKKVARLAALVGLVNIPLTYYAHTTNLESPYLCWMLWSLVYAGLAATEQSVQRFRRACFFAVAAMTTKDQAYAALLAPLALLAFLLLYRSDDKKRDAKYLLTTSLLSAFALLLIDGALFNPTGFRDRVLELSGPASQDYAQYTNDMSGRLQLIREFVPFVSNIAYPTALSLFGLVGLWFAVRARDFARLLPLLAALSFTLFFNLVARRLEARFVLPQALMLGLYVAWGLERAWSLLNARWPHAQKPLLSVAALLLAYSLHGAMSVDAQLLTDPRYEAERYLLAHVQPNERVEIYGGNVYLMHYPPTAQIERVSAGELRPNPLPGIRENIVPYEDVESRRPDWIVSPECFDWRYRVDGPAPSDMPGLRDGHQIQHVVLRGFGNRAQIDYFRSLYAGTTNYEPVAATVSQAQFWRNIRLHASLSCKMSIFRRRPDAVIATKP